MRCLIRNWYETSRILLLRLNATWNVSTSEFRSEIRSKTVESNYFLLKQVWTQLYSIIKAQCIGQEIPQIAFLTEQEENFPDNVTIHDIEDIHSELISALHNY